MVVGGWRLAVIFVFVYALVSDVMLEAKEGVGRTNSSNTFFLRVLHVHCVYYMCS